MKARVGNDDDQQGLLRHELAHLLQRLSRISEVLQDVQQRDHIELASRPRCQVVLHEPVEGLNPMRRTGMLGTCRRRLDPKNSEPGLAHTGQEVAGTATNVEEFPGALEPQDAFSQPAIERFLQIFTPLLAVVIASVELGQFFRRRLRIHVLNEEDTCLAVSPFRENKAEVHPNGHSTPPFQLTSLSEAPSGSGCRSTRRESRAALDIPAQGLITTACPFRL